MTHPKSSPGRLTILSARIGRDLNGAGNTPGWMDRKYGYTPKHGRYRDTKKQQRR